MKNYMPEINLLNAIENATGLWPQLFGPGDPNTIDVYWHAREVARLLNLRLPLELPEKDIGVAVVECVESEFISGSLIRCCSSQELARRGRKLIECIHEQGLLPFEYPETYVVALYTWHGCINMAKLLRITYVVPSGEAYYTDEIRWEGYCWLRKCWSEEQARGNPWVKYGVSLARLLEKKRGNPVVEYWIPGGSPYWDC